MKYNKKKAIQIIVNAAENYEKYLNNRQFLIIYQCGRKYEYVQIRFQSRNFLHLTGVKSELSAQRFYEACLCKKLGEKNIDIPVTLYHEDVRKMVRPVNKVIAVYSKRHDEAEYSECTYLSKKHSTLQIELKEGCIEVYEKNV